MESQLAQLVAPQRELLAGGTRGHRLEPRRYLGHVVGLPVFRMHDHTFALKIKVRLGYVELKVHKNDIFLQFFGQLTISQNVLPIQ